MTGAAAQPGPRWLQPAGVLVGLWCVALLLTRYALPTYDRLDWPIQLVTAARAMSERPYTDFSALYGPLGHYVLGMFQVVTRLDLSTAGRVFFAMNGLLELGLAALLARRLSPTASWHSSILAAALLSGPIAWNAFYSGLPVNLTLVGVLLGLHALRRDAHGARRAAIACGAVAVTLLLVRVNFGVYLAAACSLALGVEAVRQRRWDHLTAFAVAGLLTSAVALLVMWKAGFLAEYLRDTVHYVARSRARSLPIDLSGLQPLYLVAIGGLLLTTAVTCRRVWLSCRGLLLGITILGLGSYALLRFDQAHTLPLVVLLTSLLASRTPLGRWESMTQVTGLLLVGLLGLLSLRPVVGGLLRLARPDEQRVLVDGFALDLGAAGLVDALRQRAGPEDRILLASWPGSCECVSDLCANMAIYPVLGRMPGTRLWIADVATVPWREEQEATIADLERTRTRFVAFEALPERDCGGPRVKDPGLLAGWVARHYRRVTTIEAPGAPSTWYLYER